VLALTVQLEAGSRGRLGGEGYSQRRFRCSTT
jgi:hypothetical protein